MSEPARSSFRAEISPIDASRARVMEQASWRPGCPVGTPELRVLTVSRWTFDGEVRTGELITHADVADDLVRVFEALFEAGFPIERMEPVDGFEGDDDRSMAANNSSAFNGREVALLPGIWSQHAYGLAVDLNPVQNPYVRRDGTVQPPGAERFMDRSLDEPGMIRADGPVVDAFARIGWSWGGVWEPNPDYQHFSVNGL